MSYCIYIIKLSQSKGDINVKNKIRVIGIGGSGVKIVNYLANSNLEGVDFITLDMLAEKKHGSKAYCKMWIDPNDEYEIISKTILHTLTGADKLFIVSGLGGKTGCIFSKIVVHIARQAGINTTAVVTTPFAFEGKKRSDDAEDCISLLEDIADETIVISNEELMLSKGVTFSNAFELINEEICNIIKKKL